MKTILSIPKAAQIVIDEYMKLPLGGKEVSAPYFMNLKKQRAGLRVLVGKGDPGEMAREVKVTAQLKGIDLNKMDTNQIREFMITCNIGIDCSGFFAYVYNNWLRSQGKKRLITYLSFNSNNFFSKLKRKFRPIQNIGANTLTGEKNAKKITDLNNIKPGDMIRSKGRQKNSHHILLITRVVLHNDIIEEFEYVHSAKYYDDENGVKFGKVKITNPNGELKDQNWLEVKDGRNYTYEGLMNQYEDNGIRRLKNISLSYDIITE